MSDFITFEVELWGICCTKHLMTNWVCTVCILVIFPYICWGCTSTNLHHKTVTCDQHGTLHSSKGFKIWDRSKYGEWSIACCCLRWHVHNYPWRNGDVTYVFRRKDLDTKGVDPFRGLCLQQWVRLTIRYRETSWLMMIFFSSKLPYIGDDCSYFSMIFQRTPHNPHINMAIYIYKEHRHIICIYIHTIAVYI